jgi:hypothetical protein
MPVWKRAQKTKKHSLFSQPAKTTLLAPEQRVKNREKKTQPAETMQLTMTSDFSSYFITNQPLAAFEFFLMVIFFARAPVPFTRQPSPNPL